MKNKDPLLNALIDGVFAINKRIGVGGMSKVYQADVDLGRFNYSQLYAYTQVNANSHKEKLERSIEMCKQMDEMNLDLKTVRKILMLQKIPVPQGKVALKIANDDAKFDRFHAEWRSLICLNHENVIKVYGGGDFQGRPYYAMELVDNLVSAEHIMKKFPLKYKLEIIIQAAKGIKYLHDNNIIHRDIKPTNMLTSIRPDGSLLTKICDLGIAMSIASEGLVQRKNTLMGTPYYMSPEQITQKYKIDERGDVYSMGACLYKMISGKRPFFEKGSKTEIIRACLGKEMPTPIDQVESAIPKPLSSIINCAMQKRRSYRYQQMQEMVEDLQRFVNESKSPLDKVGSFSGMESVAEQSSDGYHFEKIQKKIEEKRREHSDLVVTPAFHHHSKKGVRHARSRKRKGDGATPVVLTVLALLVVGVVFLHMTGKINSAFLHHVMEEPEQNETAAQENDDINFDMGGKKVKMLVPEPILKKNKKSTVKVPVEHKQKLNKKKVAVHNKKKLSEDRDDLKASVTQKKKEQKVESGPEIKRLSKALRPKDEKVKKEKKRVTKKDKKSVEEKKKKSNLTKLKSPLKSKEDIKKEVDVSEAVAERSKVLSVTPTNLSQLDPKSKEVNADVGSVQKKKEPAIIDLISPEDFSLKSKKGKGLEGSGIEANTLSTK